MPTDPLFDVVPPDASAMLMSLRGVGYSLPTAIADIVDNSIAATAQNVWIDFRWRGDASSISIMDDGTGMSASDLRLAMKLGGRSPLEKRSATDLGRFGLGLKTASLSQCRRFTVASRKNDVVSLRRWDLDYILQDGKDWCLLGAPASGSEDLFVPLDSLANGTLVVWENLDRIAGSNANDEITTEDAFLEAIDQTTQHLAMVFHRYLDGNSPPLRIFVNGTTNRHRVRSWDPFLTDHAATIRKPVEPIPTAAGTIEVQGFILPHKDRMDARQYERAAGPDGWTSQQGFYVYRNNRLLVAGSWLGLGGSRGWTKEEAHKLARIRLDMPNTADEDWKIDIKKSTARPPARIRARLRALAEDTRETARRVFAHRGNYGPRAATPDLVRAWTSIARRDAVAYRIDRTHPAVRQVLEKAGALTDDIVAMLRIIEETVPVQKIWLDTVEKGQLQQEPFVIEPPEHLPGVLSVLYRDLRFRVGLGPIEARARLSRTEPFHAWPSLIEALPDNP